MEITAHCLVKNEENFIWFALESVLPYVDKILVWDTGSTDKTVEIIKSIKSPKINFAEKGPQDAAGVAALRQQMLNQTSSEWIMILDGDEIWWNDALYSIKQSLSTAKFDVLVSPVYMLIGDIFHYQPEPAGRYQIADKVGHYNIRFFRNTAGLTVQGIYPDEAYVTEEGIKLQDFPAGKLIFSEHKYLHASHLKRTSNQNRKQKFEIGKEFAKDFYYPESLFLPRPQIVSSPWQPMQGSDLLKSQLETPLKKIKRMLYV